MLGAVFIPLEHRWPVKASPALRRGWSTDVVHFVVDQVATTAVVAFLAIALAPPLESILPDIDAHLHGAALVAVAAVLGELLGYWGHRAMHAVPILWRLHAVHHSSPTMDWLAPNRRHVLDSALGQAASVVPLLALGLSPPVVASAFIARRIQGLFVHANIRVHVPGIRWIFATPGFHHWHHSADPKYFNCNFAGQCPLVDWIFGTLHMPVRAWPAAYGIADGADPLPLAYLDRMRWPFAGICAAAVAHGRRLAAIACVAFAAVGGAWVFAAPSAAIPVGSRYECAPIEASTTPALPRVVITADSVVVIDSSGSSMANVRNVEGDVPHGIGIRVTRFNGAPLTILIRAHAEGAIHAAAKFLSASGHVPGTCDIRSEPRQSSGQALGQPSGAITG